MKTSQISVEYRDIIQEHCGQKGVPSIVVDNKIEWVSEPGIFTTQIRYMRFRVGASTVSIDLQQLCKVNGWPYNYIGKPKGGAVFAVPEAYTSLIADYCDQLQIDYESVISQIDVVQEDIEIPLSVEKTHMSVRSTQPGRVYAILYVPKLLKFLRDPSYGTWMYISEQYREAVEIAADLLFIDIEFLKKHIKWVTDEDDVFMVMQTCRVARYMDGKYKYLNVNRFKKIALGEEPVSYDEFL